MPFQRDIIQMPRQFATLASSELRRPLPSGISSLGDYEKEIWQASAYIEEDLS